MFSMNIVPFSQMLYVFLGNEVKIFQRPKSVIYILRYGPSTDLSYVCQHFASMEKAHWLINCIQLLTGFEDNSSFVWPENGSVARSRRLRATDLFEGQTELLLFEKSVYICFVIHLHFFKIFLFTHPLDVFSILVRQVRESGRRLDIVTSI